MPGQESFAKHFLLMTKNNDNNPAAASPITAEIQSALADRLAVVQAVLPKIEARLRELQSGDQGIQTKTNDMDLVTRADLESEALLKAAISEKFPEDAILAEESGRSEGVGTAADFLWALDPVDGTINYAHGLPLYSVSIGILWKNQPAAGLVSLPALGNRYRAIRGQGATRDEQTIRVSDTSEISQALLVTGFPYNRHQMLPTLLAGVETALKSVRGIRRTGSAAIDLCWLAEGRFDCYYEFNLNPWDTCAGTVILEEAGGAISQFRGEAYAQGDYQLAASNGHLQAALLDVLAPIADAQRLPPED